MLNDLTAMLRKRVSVAPIHATNHLEERVTMATRGKFIMAKAKYEDVGERKSANIAPRTRVSRTGRDALSERKIADKASESNHMSDYRGERVVACSILVAHNPSHALLPCVIPLFVLLVLPLVLLRTGACCKT
jgi:hypothetical protein